MTEFDLLTTVVGFIGLIIMFYFVSRSNKTLVKLAVSEF